MTQREAQVRARLLAQELEEPFAVYYHNPNRLPHYVLPRDGWLAAPLAEKEQLTSRDYRLYTTCLPTSDAERALRATAEAYRRHVAEGGD